jgi:hypothetical protein
VVIIIFQQTVYIPSVVFGQYETQQELKSLYLMNRANKMCLELIDALIDDFKFICLHFLTTHQRINFKTILK